MTTAANPGIFHADAGELAEAWASLWRMVRAPAPRESEAKYSQCCACGECWQYLGTVIACGRAGQLYGPGRPVHEFRHRCGRGCGERSYVAVPASPGWTPATTPTSARTGKE